jgi:sRNA-binding carbon storage regulator CsrA
VKLGIEAPDRVRVLRGELAFETPADRDPDVLELKPSLFTQPEEFAVCSDQFPHPHIA